jgi:hypothetical protein
MRQTEATQGTEKAPRARAARASALIPVGETPSDRGTFAARLLPSLIPLWLALAGLSAEGQTFSQTDCRSYGLSGSVSCQTTNLGGSDSSPLGGDINQAAQQAVRQQSRPTEIAVCMNKCMTQGGAPSLCANLCN